MFIDRLLNQGNAPLIEQTVRFTAARQKLLAENVANVSTPGYQQKDLSVERFQQMLRERIDARCSSPPGTTRFDDLMGEVSGPAQRGILFHDRNNRSMEQLMSDGAKNALYHNMMIELLRKQIGSIESALKERVA
jgi:flagellar basal-body rod protein FlgB